MGRPEKTLVDEESPAGALGAALRDLRHAAGLSQTELAALSGCAPATVGQVERARFLPSSQLVDAWVEQLPRSGRLWTLWEQAVIRSHRSRAANHNLG